jgi:hypothetical protein
VFPGLHVAVYQENDLSGIVTMMGFYSYEGQARSLAIVKASLVGDITECKRVCVLQKK